MILLSLTLYVQSVISNALDNINKRGMYKGNI